MRMMEEKEDWGERNSWRRRRREKVAAAAKKLSGRTPWAFVGLRGPSAVQVEILSDSISQPSMLFSDSLPIATTATTPSFGAP